MLGTIMNLFNTAFYGFSNVANTLSNTYTIMGYELSLIEWIFGTGLVVLIPIMFAKWVIGIIT